MINLKLQKRNLNFLTISLFDKRMILLNKEKVEQISVCDIDRATYILLRLQGLNGLACNDHSCHDIL